MQKQVLKTSSLRISETQRKAWLSAANTAGYGALAEFIRTTVDQSVRAGVASKRDVDDLIKALGAIHTELQRHGNNLNQIARHANSTGVIKGIDEALQDNEQLSSSVSRGLAELGLIRFRKAGNR